MVNDEDAQQGEPRAPRFTEATSIVSPTSPPILRPSSHPSPAPRSKQHRTSERETSPRSEHHFWRKIAWQWALFTDWRGWPVIRAYMPMLSGLMSWVLMGVLAASGPLTNLWFAVKGELKLGATGYCEADICTNAVFYDAPALSNDWAAFPRWGLSALLLSHGVVAGIAALIATFANLRTGLAHCRSKERSSARTETAKEQASRVFATCMMCTVIAVAILGVGLLIWTSQSFAETEIGQMIWYCLPVVLAIWLFSHGMNRRGDEDYHEEDDGDDSSSDAETRGH